jgi:hypothetical protein
MLDEGYLLLVDISLYVYEQCNVLDKVVLCSNSNREEANSSIRLSHSDHKARAHSNFDA